MFSWTKLSFRKKRLQLAYSFEFSSRELAVALFSQDVSQQASIFIVNMGRHKIRVNLPFLEMEQNI